MTKREQAIRYARRFITDVQLVSFLRAIGKRGSSIAARLVNQQLDDGESIDSIFYTGDQYGFLLEVDQNSAATIKRVFDRVNELLPQSEAAPLDPASRICISFGCRPAPSSGDGSQWLVAFDDAGNVLSLKQGIAWIA